MRVAIALDRGGGRAWHRHLAERLERAGAEVGFLFGAAAPALPGAVRLTLDLERTLLHRGRPHGLDVLEDRALAAAPEGTPDLLLDMTSEGIQTLAARRACLLFDGGRGEAALLDALLAGRQPVIEWADRETGLALARGRAAPEGGPGLAGGAACALARVATLAARLVTAPMAADAGPSQAASHGPADPRRYLARAAMGQLARRLYRLACWSPHWRVGWRFVDGADAWDTGLDGPPWQALPSPHSRFYADPFVISWQGRTVLFVEELDHRVNKGFISAMPFDENGPSGGMAPVLEEPWHLSYPFLVARGDALYMIPESSSNREVVLYRCIDFPHRWERQQVLLSGTESGDATIIEHDGRWWMFVVDRDGFAGGWSDTLCLYHAPDLTGPWEPHPLNPVLVEAGTARPAGAMVRRGGRLLRPVQDCTWSYGAAVNLMEVTRLDLTAFEQRQIGRLAPGPRFPGRKLHTLNRAGRLEVIDGAVPQPKWPPLAGLAKTRFAPADEASA